MARKALPPLPSECPGRPKQDRYKEQYGVIVLCANEAEHQRIYEQLRAQGFTCRAVRT